MVSIISEQLNSINAINENDAEEVNFAQSSVKKIAFVRDPSFNDHLLGVIRKKDLQITELQKELQRVVHLTKDNELLALKVN